MKFLWILLLMATSCKTFPANRIACKEDKGTDHIIEIRLVNIGTSYSTVISAIQKSGFGRQIHLYPINTIYQPLTVLTFPCYNISNTDLTRLRTVIVSCGGVLRIYDTVIN